MPCETWTTISDSSTSGTHLSSASTSTWISRSPLIVDSIWRLSDRQWHERRRRNDPHAARLAVHARLEAGRLHHEHVAGQAVQHAFGSIADEYAFQPGSRDRTHDDDLRAHRLRGFWNDMHGVTIHQVSSRTGNPGLVHEGLEVFGVLALLLLV